jgi:hypothetical protein
VDTAATTTCTPTLLDLFHQAAERERLLDQVLPFGRHRGKPVRVVRVDYCRWALSQVALSPELRRALELKVQEYDRRKRA